MKKQKKKGSKLEKKKRKPEKNIKRKKTQQTTQLGNNKKETNQKKVENDNIIKVIEYKDKLIKSKQSNEELRRDMEGEYIEHEKLQRKSAHVEVRCEVLVEKLKENPCRAIFRQHEEDRLEVDDTKIKINEEHEMDAKIEYFDEIDLDSVLGDEKDLLREYFDESNLDSVSEDEKIAQYA